MASPSDRGLTLRLATLDDLPAIARLFAQLDRPASVDELAERWRRWSAAGERALVAIAADGEVLGVACLSRMETLHRPWPLGRISALVVDAAHRGRGVGRALVAEAERLFADEGCGLLEVSSNLRRVDAHAFYERLGYERTSYRFARELT